VSRITAALVVLFAFAICCSGAAATVATAMAGESCCERECARESASRCCEFLAPEKRVDQRPAAVAAALPHSVAPDASVSLVVVPAATASRLFDPLTTIRLRI
jgi:hypothetical protein